MTDAAAAMVDAATVVVLREGEAAPECLMVRKSRGQAFGGAWVFPGGRVEAADGDGLPGVRQAAVREVAEETGLGLDPEVLVPFSHWTPPLDAPRRFSTWFFMTTLPHGTTASDIVTDGGEIAEHAWITPAAALSAHRYQELELHPPTWLTLHHLGRHTGVASALQDATSNPVQRFSTRIVTGGEGDGILVALWRPDAAYPATETAPPRPLGTPGPRHRLYMDPAGWRYQRSEK